MVGSDSRSLQGDSTNGGKFLLPVDEMRHPNLECNHVLSWARPTWAGRMRIRHW